MLSIYYPKFSTLSSFFFRILNIFYMQVSCQEKPGKMLARFLQRDEGWHSSCKGAGGGMVLAGRELAQDLQGVGGGRGVPRDPGLG